MTIAKEHEIEICSFCKGSKWRKIQSEQDMQLYKCVKCGNIVDRKLRGEDEKHKIYHDTEKEPEDKMNLTGQSTDEKRWIKTD